MNELKIAIISVYMGPPPLYFNAWVESCRVNNSIDFIYVTDHNIELNVPNLKIIRTSLDKLKNEASKLLGFNVSLESPFKLCDYKPMYGLLFQEYLKGYDYWGHCDIDLIWGDLRSFFIKYNLYQYDKFLPLGHLSLYRNSYENNRRFMETVEGLSDYKKIYTSRENYLFDEVAIPQIYRRHGLYFEKIIFADIWPSKKRYTMCSFLKYYQSIYNEFRERCHPINYKQQIFMWEKGKIYQYFIDKGEIKKREFLYIHIQKRNWKMVGKYSDRMIVSNNIVKSVKSNDLSKLIEKYNHYSLWQEIFDDLNEFVSHCWNWLKKRVTHKSTKSIIVENQK